MIKRMWLDDDTYKVEMLSGEIINVRGKLLKEHRKLLDYLADELANQDQLYGGKTYEA